ncbi:phenylacetate--CoA ligase family protein [Desulfosporosinus sp. BICA1-9]|uniref:phenylacetate--CoA ligase family protein n=1 Tax=Desulfosporosinus sp. BICA1-9 TaxID=1531958 RepID=UPI00054BED95|nr:AMP-binding protein [Desulfosporosinus sp. BICA1-9]
MDAEQTYFDMEVEPILNTPKMREIQWEGLQKAIRFFYEKVPFERRRMDKAGVKPEDIRSFEDFARAIPIISQEDFRGAMQEGDFDLTRVYRDLFGEERFNDLFLLSSTSGTTGIPTPYPLFRSGLDRVADIFGRIAWRAGIRPGDRMALCFGLSMHAAGTPQLFWYRSVPGLTIIPMGAEAGTERLLTFFKAFKPTVFTGTPSLAIHLIERAEDVLKEPIKNIGFKTLILGAEPGAGIPELRTRLESEYGAKVFDIGAGYGVSCDHPVYQGMHWVAGDYCYYELVDPETKESIPLEDGATGLAVFTPIEPKSGHFFFSLRFTLNDIHQVFTKPCPCGRSGMRYKVVGRADDMLKVKGVPVYPAAIQGIIQSFVPKVSGVFRIVLDQRPPRVVPPLKLKLEYGEGIREGDLGPLEHQILVQMHKQLKIRPSINWVPFNSLDRSTKKTQLIEKLYEK